MSYVDEVLVQVVKENPHEPEFHQSIRKNVYSRRPGIDANEQAKRKDAMLERMVNSE